VPCSEVLEQVYAYLDHEISDHDCDEIRQHLDECGPCLREFGLEEVVKKLVAKHCGCDPAPANLRGKILVRIRQVQAEIEVAD
jgi:mycothiol system anti-sigma-R factor